VLVVVVCSEKTVAAQSTSSGPSRHTPPAAGLPHRHTVRRLPAPPHLDHRLLRGPTSWHSILGPMLVSTALDSRKACELLLRLRRSVVI